jgi:hypothetical protein
LKVKLMKDFATCTQNNTNVFELSVALTHNVPFTCHFHNLALCIGLTRDSNPISKRFYRYIFFKFITPYVKFPFDIFSFGDGKIHY